MTADDFTRLLVPAVPELYRYLQCRIYNSADHHDILQVSLLTAWRLWPKYNPVKPFVAWLIQIGKNCLMHYLRDMKRLKRSMAVSLEELWETAGDDPEHALGLVNWNDPSNILETWELANGR